MSVLSDAELRVLSAWWQTQTVVGAAKVVGVAEQTAKNLLAQARLKARAATNEQTVRFFWKQVARQRWVSGDRLLYRTLRYQFDDEYRERAKRHAREGMRKQRSIRATESQKHYERLVSEQGKACFICGTTESIRRDYEGNSARLAVDHDHDCCKDGCLNCIRGLLCTSCNLMLGIAKDSPERLEDGAAYLRMSAVRRSHNYQRQEAG